MNKVILVGRLTREIELKTAGESSVVKNSLAVDRRFKNKNGEIETDFINITAFGKTAEFIEKYCKKGTKLVIEGRIQTGSYEKEGQKVYTTDVIVENVEFAESKKTSEAESVPNTSEATGDGFMNIPDGIDEELPFN